MAIDKWILGVAGEFAVAAELCRRGMYAQLTLGHRKRTDLLVESEKRRMFRIEVKTKQGREWPNCRGIAADDSFLVFVDFENKPDTARPDFYILNVHEWQAFVKAEAKRYEHKHPGRRVQITKDNVAICLDEVNRYNQPYTGSSVRPEKIKEYQEDWQKLARDLEL